MTFILQLFLIIDELFRRQTIREHFITKFRMNLYQLEFSIFVIFMMRSDFKITIRLQTCDMIKIRVWANSEAFNLFTHICAKTLL